MTGHEMDSCAHHNKCEICAANLQHIAIIILLLLLLVTQLCQVCQLKQIKNANLHRHYQPIPCRHEFNKIRRPQYEPEENFYKDQYFFEDDFEATRRQMHKIGNEIRHEIDRVVDDGEKGPWRERAWHDNRPDFRPRPIKYLDREKHAFIIKVVVPRGTKESDIVLNFNKDGMLQLDFKKEQEKTTDTARHIHYHALSHTFEIPHTHASPEQIKKQIHDNVLTLTIPIIQ